jgi:TolC family type I secretion outer membrane protein
MVGSIALPATATPAGADEFPPYPDDPFDTRKTVSPSLGRPAYRSSGDDACAPSRSEAETLRLIDVVDQALCHNPQTRQAWANARMQATQLGIAEAAYLPTVNLTVPVSRNKNNAGAGFANSIPTGGGGAGSRQTETTRISPILSLNLLLFDFGGRDARVDAARKLLEAANWSHAATLQNVLFSAIQSYYQWFSSHSALAAAEASERSNEEALKAAAYRYEVGAAALADKLQAQTAFAQAKVNRQTAAGNASVALGALANAMGLKPSGKLKFEPPANQAPDSLRDEDLQILIEEAKVLRPDLAAAEAQVQAAESDIKSARSASLPTLSLVGNYTYLDTLGLQSISSWSVGVQVAVPLFTGFTNTYQIHGAEEQAAIQEANRDRLDQSIALEVWRAYYNLKTAKETFRSTEDLLASATQGEELALGRYKAGAGTIVEVLNAESSLANARFQRVQAEYNWRIGKAQLAQAMGRLDLADFSESPKGRRDQTPGAAGSRVPASRERSEKLPLALEKDGMPDRSRR